MQKAIICDLDGTLADVEHRQVHVQSKPKNWKAFHEGMVDDKLNVWCAELLSAMKKEGYRIILLTGRDEPYRKLTIEWLKRFDISYDLLLMRADKDFRPDDIVKKEIYQNVIKPEYDVIFVVDDRKKVVEMWREIGLVCLQCAWGDF